MAMTVTFIIIVSVVKIKFCQWIRFPDSSVGKESACNAGDPGLIPGSGRSAGEGIDYPLQYSWASLVAQLVKKPPARWETWVQSLGWEDPLETGKAIHSSILAWRITWTVACQAPMTMKFSRQDDWNGLPFPSPGDLPNPGIELLSPTLQASSLPAEPQGKLGMGSASWYGPKQL